MPPTSAIGSVRNSSVASRMLPKAACSRKKITHARPDPVEQEVVLGRAALGGLAEDLRMDPRGKSTVANRCLDLA